MVKNNAGLHNENKDFVRISATIKNSKMKLYTKRNSVFPSMLTVEHFSNFYEVTIVKEGKITYSIEGEIYSIFANQMIFINGNILHHRIYSPDEGEFETMLISPEIFLAGNYNKLNQIVNGEGAPSFLLFSKGSSRHREIVSCCENAMAAFSKEENDLEFETISEIYKAMNKLITYITYMEKFPSSNDMDNQAKQHEILIMKKMISYVQKNFNKKINLSLLGKEAEICRSRCCAIFKKYMGITANDYISYYRLAASIEMIELEDIPYSKAAKICGFSGASYYSELFKKVSGCTPTEFFEKLVK